MALFDINVTATTVKNLLFLGSIGFATITGSFTLFVKFAWPVMIAQVAEDLDIATRADMAALNARIDALTGEDGIFLMNENASFVHEPVNGVADVTMTLVGRRTQRGEDCVFVGGRPLYVDQADIPYPGELLEVIRQLDTSESKLLLELSPPHRSMANGRVGVYLSLEYACPFGTDGAMVTVFDTTETIYFRLERKF